VTQVGSVFQCRRGRVLGVLCGMSRAPCAHAHIDAARGARDAPRGTPSTRACIDRRCQPGSRPWACARITAAAPATHARARGSWTPSVPRIATPRRRRRVRHRCHRAWPSAAAAAALTCALCCTASIDLHLSSVFDQVGFCQTIAAYFKVRHARRASTRSARAPPPFVARTLERSAPPDAGGAPPIDRCSRRASPAILRAALRRCICAHAGRRRCADRASRAAQCAERRDRRRPGARPPQRWRSARRRTSRCWRAKLPAQRARRTQQRQVEGSAARVMR
jgi:hypothetical protein